MGIKSADRGLWGHPVYRQSLPGHRVCRQRTVLASGLQTEDCLGIGSTDRGPVGVSGLQTEVQWGHWGRRLKSVGGSGTETEVCVGIWYAHRVSEDIESADRCLRGHRFCIQKSAG